MNKESKQKETFEEVEGVFEEGIYGGMVFGMLAERSVQLEKVILKENVYNGPGGGPGGHAGDSSGW